MITAPPKNFPPSVSRIWLRKILIFLVGAVIAIEILILSPRMLDDPSPREKLMTQEDLLAQIGHEEETLAPGIPVQKVPEYFIQGFNYIASSGNQKQWKLNAEKAVMFHKEKLVHARRIHATLYDADGRMTLISGREAKYFLNKRDLEIFGDVVAEFSDGFTTRSNYLRYLPQKNLITIPVRYLVSGEGKPDQDMKKISYSSFGMDYHQKTEIIQLHQKVYFMIEKEALTESGYPDVTVIESDQARIERTKNLAFFTMNASRPAHSRFVRLNQPDLFLRSRRLRMDYTSGSKDLVSYLFAQDDVLIEEIKPEQDKIRYATGGQAAFSRDNQVITLTEFPQIYEDSDTVTGDVIVMHRDTDQVEVFHSNSYQKGNTQE